jgi:hypothetical protein
MMIAHPNVLHVRSIHLIRERFGAAVVKHNLDAIGVWWERIAKQNPPVNRRRQCSNNSMLGRLVIIGSCHVQLIDFVDDGIEQILC